ncbi:TonB-dependent receptor [Aquimarina hainanensis]|uniref:TonB-dependent receptor n=1 Tax=Aquimarina hainanensis TaxID=1578017 RepID=A0ABW5N3Z3_9FLAO|nr:TonB-dependent receptor [Aquimarina sp. TRL1]QKX04560.1 TonB-dependent receptor [Aquimarina sp. TRL1]
MKKVTFLFFVILLSPVIGMFAQGTITGIVHDASTNAPLPGANILEVRTSNGASTDFDGKFSIKPTNSTGTLNISYVGFASTNITFDVSNGNVDLGIIKISPDNSLDEVIIVSTGIIDLAEDRKTPIAVSTVTEQEIQEKAVGNVELPEIIKSTPSVFVSNQTGFGDGSLYIRGFDDTNTAILLNGQPINGMEDGRVYWSNWSGLTDIANAVQVQRGLGSSKLAISSVGGTVNIVMKAADRTKGGFARFLGGNDSYFKGTIGYDTGLSDNGWAFSVLLDYWQSHRKWAEGTFGQGQNYYFSAGYKPNDNHSFNFLITGAPQAHGQRWSQRRSTLEENPKFNQHWGFTEGLANNEYSSNIDSERRNFYHKPVTNLSWDWNITDNSSLSSVLYASWGRGGGTGPRGDGRVRTDAGQLNYYAIEQQNALDPDGIGNSGDYFILDGGEEEGNYIRRASVNNHQWYGLISNFTTDLSDKVSWNVGVDFRLYRGDHFRQVVDLYGLNGWGNDRPDGAVVTETYKADPWAALFNFAKEDQRIDYDYSENINYQGLFSQIEYAGDKFSSFLQASVSNQSYKREGRFTAVGNSEGLNKIGYNLKGGLGYSIVDGHTIYLNTGFYSRQPFLDNVFQNIRRSNDLVQPEVDNEDIIGIESGYKIKVANLQINFNAYYTKWDNRVILSSGTIDPNNTPDNNSDDVNVNFFDRGITQIHSGVEVDLNYKATSWMNLRGYISGASWKFDGKVTRDMYNDDTNELISTQSDVDITGVKVTTAPQFTAGLGTKIKLVKGMSFDANINYYAEHYMNDIDFNDANLQTENIGKIKPFSLTDLGLTYDFNFDNSQLTFRGNVYNVFDEVRIQQTDNFGFINTNGVTFNGSLKYKF